jgi:hypothetical protein
MKSAASSDGETIVAISLSVLGVTHSRKLFDKQNGGWMWLEFVLSKMLHRHSVFEFLLEKRTAIPIYYLIVQKNFQS